MVREIFFQRAADTERPDLNTNKIKEWRSIITLIVFVLTSKSAMRAERCRLSTNRNTYRHKCFVPLPRTHLHPADTMEPFP
jgi:hypothetical protein